VKADQHNHQDIDDNHALSGLLPEYYSMEVDPHAVHDTADNTASVHIKERYLVWGIPLAFVFILVYVKASPMMEVASFRMKCIAVVAGAFVGLCGALLGGLSRDLVKPDSIMTRGGVSRLIRHKVFRRMYPQLIGMLGGIVITTVMVL